ncbi:hypothetical protein [Aquimarina sp. AU474]|uniref:hypothetical protein n=1 Tax=Aquimarina sp. AU474 TaxID=2108529 RepID=UPI000D69E8D5|nr:hypothetical protein [Aquimarina sp. AU474]
MNYNKTKKIASILLIMTGAIALISEIGADIKNYYVQSIGVVVLMLGLFLINSGLSSKTTLDSKEYFEEEE